MVASNQIENYSLLEKITLLLVSVLMILLPLESILSAFHCSFVSIHFFLVVWFSTIILCLIVRKWLWLLVALVLPWEIFMFCTWFLESAIWYYGKEIFGLNLY